jgi:DnaJ like chaperone protein
MSFLKWIGGSLGWSVGGPIGAVAGFALGALFDNGLGNKENNQQTFTSQNSNTQAGDFGMSMVILSAAVMKADNKIMKSELEFVKSYLVQQFGASQAKDLTAALKEVLKTDVPVRQVCLQIRANMSHPMRLQLMHYLFGVGYADGLVETAELQTLNNIARYLGVSQKDFFSINARFGGQGGTGGRARNSSSLGITAAYQILEIDSSVEDQDVKKAYRKMAKKYHPDKVAALGPEFQNAAKEKFQKVQQAYEEVKEKRGMN